VEDTTIILIISLIGIFSLIGMKMFNPNQAKTKVKTRKDNAYDTLDKVNEETITRLSKELKKESGRANRLQAIKDQLEGNEEEEEELSKQVTFEEITALVKQTYPKYSPMLPLVKDKVMEITKGMTLEQILDYVKQLKGDQQSKPGDPNSITQGFEQRSDYA